MNANIDYLVQRQAAILAKIDNLRGEELASLANDWPEGPDEISKAWRLLRGLVRTGNVGAGDLKIARMRIDNPGIVPSPPGFFVIDLLPLPEGGFDCKQVMQTPVVAWEIDRYGYCESGDTQHTDD